MKIVNMQVIKNDLLQNITIYDKYIALIPQLKDEFAQFKQTPNCGTCINKLFPPLFNLPNIVELLMQIYGDQVQLDKTIQQPVAWQPETTIEEIPIADYKDYIINKINIDTELNIRVLNTCVLPNGNILLTLLGNRRTKPIQQAPIQQAPIQQAPIQPAPIQPAPIQPAPIQQAPIQQAPIQQAPIQQAPIQPAPSTI